MFREMRRIRQQLSKEETVAILERNTAGTLALLGDGGYPYSVPISYAYNDGKIIFHGALSGHKFDAISACDKASFSVIDLDDILPEKYTTRYRSAIAFGRVRMLTDENEKRAAADILAAKYRPGYEAERTAEIEGSFSRLCMMELNIEHLSGKQAKELVKN